MPPKKAKIRSKPADSSESKQETSKVQQQKSEKGKAKQEAPEPQASKEEEEQEQQQQQQQQPEDANGNEAKDEPAEDKMDVDSDVSKKRKSPPTGAKKKAPPKIPRQGSRSSGRTPGSADGPTTKQLLNYLLSADSIAHCFPEDELKASKSKESKKTYAMTPPSSFTPFEQLIISYVLSKSLSSSQGLRIVRTLLNAPFSFSKPQKVKEAGPKRIAEGLAAAKVEQKQVTAEYIYQMAEVYSDDEKMYELSEEVNDDGADGVVRHIKAALPKLGQAGAESFCRRIQACDGWGEAVWPFADGRTVDALRELGIKVASGSELQELVEKEVDWDKVGDMGLTKLVGTGREDDESPEDMEYEQRVQVEYVVLLERAAGCVLEGNVPQLKKAAKEWQ